MKLSQHLFFLASCLFILSCGGNSYKNGTPTQLGESFFLILKANDTTGVKTLFPGKEDWEDLADIKGIPEDKKQDFKTDFFQRIGKMKAQELSGFTDLQDDLANAGIQIKDVKWNGVHVEKTGMDSGVEVANLTLNFEANGKPQIIFLKDVGHLDRGWFLNRIPDWGDRPSQ